MIKQRSHREHKRNRSELLFVESKEKDKALHPSKSKNKKKITTNSKANSVAKLIGKSLKKAKVKRVVIENIDDGYDDTEGNDNFFAFGKRLPSQFALKLKPNMQQIEEVPDTITNSQRYKRSQRKSQRNYSENKENAGDFKNRQIHPHEKKNQNVSIKLNLTKLDNEKSKLKLNKKFKKVEGSSTSRKSSANSHKSHKEYPYPYQKSLHSFEQLPNCKNYSNQHKTHRPSDSQLWMLFSRTNKIEKGMKMMWQCMGQLWQSTRAQKYISQKERERPK